MQKVAKEQFLQIIVVKLNMRLYGVPTIQMEVITTRRHVLKIPTCGKGHYTDGGQHWLIKNSDFMPFLLFFQLRMACTDWWWYKSYMVG